MDYHRRESKIKCHMSRKSQLQQNASYLEVITYPGQLIQLQERRHLLQEYRSRTSLATGRNPLLWRNHPRTTTSYHRGDRVEAVPLRLQRQQSQSMKLSPMTLYPRRGSRFSIYLAPRQVTKESQLNRKTQKSHVSTP